MPMTVFAIIWGIALFIFLFYTLISIYFRFLSYPRDYHHFAGNGQINKIDPNLHYFIIVPCFNEGSVIKKTAENLLKFSKIELIVVDDDSSDDSVEQLLKIDSTRFHLLKRTLPNAHTGKGDVLNFALDYIQQVVKKRNYDENDVIIGVIDADAKLAENAIQRLDLYFSSPKSIVTQMRVKMYPHFKNLLQVLQDVEFFSVNHMAQIMRMYTGTVGLSGNGQFFRMKPILAAVGPHPWGDALLDDYELTIKMMLKSIHVDYMTDTYVYQEALTSPKKFIRQRSRWVQGDLNCLKYLPMISKSSAISHTQRLGMYYFFIQPWVNLLADIAIVVLTINYFVNENELTGNESIYMKILVILILFLFSIGWGIVFSLIYRRDLRHFGEPTLSGKLAVVLPIGISYLYLLLFFSILMAFGRWINHKNSWIKTEHGKS